MPSSISKQTPPPAPSKFSILQHLSITACSQCSSSSLACSPRHLGRSCIFTTFAKPSTDLCRQNESSQCLEVSAPYSPLRSLYSTFTLGKFWLTLYHHSITCSNLKRETTLGHHIGSIGLRISRGMAPGVSLYTENGD